MEKTCDDCQYQDSNGICWHKKSDERSYDTTGVEICKHFEDWIVDKEAEKE